MRVFPSKSSLLAMDNVHVPKGTSLYLCGRFSPWFLYRNGGSRLAAAARGGTTTSYKQRELQLKEVLLLRLVMAQLPTYSQFSGNHSKLQLKRLNPYPNDASSRSSTHSRESLNLGVQAAPAARIVDTATAAARD
ncbi:unnamed protein product [Sphagnum jensenii]|uniref:Uncharacterized protein n=1 Tax=Sphagnum jensenii TaxID=128206 RepID=A0ABP1BM89_9BRYO